MVFRAIGSATLQTAEKSGIAKNVLQPPYPCSLPLAEIDDVHDRAAVESILDFTFESVLDMLHDNLPKLNASVTDAKLNKPWKSVGYKDKAPGGDLVLESRPHVGAYNFARAHMTFRNVPPEMILHYMHAYTLEMRQKYSENISAYDILRWNPELPPEVCFDGVGNDKFNLPELAAMGIRDWHIEYNAYYAPPPVACRDMIYLVEKRYVPETNRYYIYGTTIDFPGMEKATSKKCVRGHVMFGWEYEVMPNGDTKAHYVSCMNPSGWTPAFLVGFFKSAIGKELTQSREMLYEILRQDAKLSGDANNNNNSAHVHPSPAITLNTIKPASGILINSAIGTPAATTAAPVQSRAARARVYIDASTPTPSPSPSRQYNAGSSPLGTRRGAPQLSLLVPARESGLTPLTNDSLRTPFSLSASDVLRDDSFSFLSRRESTVRFDVSEDATRESANPLYSEDVRLCDAFEDEELCL